MGKKAYSQAENKLKSAYNKFEEVGNPKQLWITNSTLAYLYEKMKRADLEREQWQIAKALVESTADGLDDETLRTTFINAAPIIEILDRATC